MSTKLLKLADLGVVSPEVCVELLLNDMRSGKLKVDRIVLVVETADGELETRSSGAKSDIVSCIGLMQTAVIRAAQLTEFVSTKAI